MSDPRQHLGLLFNLPDEVPALRDVVQGLAVHIFWSKRYGLELDDERSREVQLRPVHRKYTRLLERNPEPLWIPRPLEQKLICNCRDFSLLLVSMLVTHRVPCRARCGFATYFLPDHFEDHWVVEYWNAAQARWVRVDAQLDSLQCQALDIDFDPLDVPAGKFLTGGEAWKMCQSGQADPDTFGIFEYHGRDFVRGNVLRDFLALNKVEVLPWDFWGLLMKPLDESGPEEVAIIDRLADLSNRTEEDTFNEIRALYEQDARLQIPPAWAD